MVFDEIRTYLSDENYALNVIKHVLKYYIMFNHI